MSHLMIKSDAWIFFMRIISLILLLFLSNQVFAQELDISELCNEITPQEKAIAKINGFDVDEICSKQSSSSDSMQQIAASSPVKITPRETISSSGDQTVSNALTPVPVSGISTQDSPKSLLPFGYDLLAGSPETFAPIMNVPVDPEYLLGPGDGINILLYGKTNGSFSLEIDRDGFLNIPDIGPVAISGLNFKEAKQILRIRIANQIIGTSASITMGNLRSMQVFILGESYRPGAYTISSLSTVTHALLASGGITDIGSLRNIQVLRNERKVANLDLYDLLLKGDRTNDVRLQAGDVIFIPTAKEMVSISGQVLRPAIYEIKNENTIEDLISMAGGLSPKSYPKVSTLDRIREDGFLTILDLDLTQKASKEKLLRAGDHLKISAIKEIRRDVLTLSGELYYPSNYKWKEGLKVSDLIDKIQDFPPRFDSDFSVIIRSTFPDLYTEVIKIDLNEIIANPKSNENILLEPGDDLKIFSLDSDRALFLSEAVSRIIDQTQYPELPAVVSISGPLKSSGMYPLMENMTLKDLFDFSGGFTQGFVNFDYALMTRVNKLNGFKTIEKIDLREALNPATSRNYKLLPNDDIYIFSLNESPNNRLENVLNDLASSTTSGKPAEVAYINGSIKFPGTYPLTESGITISELIKAAGGLVEQSYTLKAELSSLDFSNPEKVSVKNSIIDIKEVLESGRGDVKLKPYDNLAIKNIPEFSDRKYVSIYGEVKFPGAYVVSDGEKLSSIIKRAGGLTDLADENASIFTRENLRIAELEQIRELTARLNDQLSNEQLVDINSGEGVSDSSDRIQREAIESLNYSNPIGRLVIPLGRIIDNKEDILVEDGDVLYLPSKRTEVTIIGEVYRPGSHMWSERNNLNDYLEKAGGRNDQADNRGIYIVRASGEVVVPSKYLFRTSVKIMPGDTIVVPIDLDETEIRGIPLMATISRIIYELAIGAAAVKSFEN